MKYTNTRSELDHTNSNKKLDPHKRRKAIPLRLNDRSIQAVNSDFQVPNGDGTYTTVDAVRYSFPECRGKTCQGLVMIHRRSKELKRDRKILFLEYWVNGVAKKYHFPDYDKERFNVRHLEKRIADLRLRYGNPNNLTWDMDIQLGEQESKINKFKDQLKVTQIKTIREVIEEFYKAGFLKIKNDGASPGRKTINTESRYLIGYSERTDVYKLVENSAREGVFVFKSGYQSWEDVFKKYPSKFNPEKNKGAIIFDPKVSIYDGPLSVFKITELTQELIQNYISSAPKVSVRLEMKLALSYIWHFALNKGWLPGTPLNPFTDIKLAKPKVTHMTQWNKKEFTQDQLCSLFHGCNDLEIKYPGQPQLFQLLQITGRREETLINIKWSNIEFKELVESYVDDQGKTHLIKYYGVIYIRGTIENKTEHTDKIPITKTIKQILDSLWHRRTILEPWKQFIDWVFVSPRVKDKDYLRKDKDGTLFAHRLKDPRKCWNALLDHTNLKGKAMRKMFRTTYQNKVDRLKGVHSSWDAITITGQNDTRAHEQNYMVKKLTPKVLHHFNQIDEEFSNEIRTRKNN